MTRRRSRTALFAVVFVALSLLLAFAVGETFVRVKGRIDADGNFYFRDRPIPPLALPVRQARTLIDEYLRDQTGYMAYDADAGWSIRPRSCARDGMYCANGAGLRSDREYSTSTTPDLLRVSLFGDSFIHGDDVALGDSLGPLLEGALKQRGLTAEVLNFGVGGFGIDQAYRRYSAVGSRYDTDIVVAGLQLENVSRHLMVFRIIAFPQTKIPFSKPRYYFDGPSLLVANVPTVLPERVPDTLAQFHRSPLRRYEFFYNHRYEPRWYRRSRMVAVIEEALNRKEDVAPDAMAADGEGIRITRAILERFGNDVAATRKPFLLVYLPLKGNLEAQLGGMTDPWEPLLAPLRGSFTIVDPTPRLLAIAREQGVDAVASGHYTANGNRAVAEALAEAIAKLDLKK